MSTESPRSTFARMTLQAFARWIGVLVLLISGCAADGSDDELWLAAAPQRRDGLMMTGGPMCNPQLSTLANYFDCGVNDELTYLNFYTEDPWLASKIYYERMDSPNGTTQLAALVLYNRGSKYRDGNPSPDVSTVTFLDGQLYGGYDPWTGTGFTFSYLPAYRFCSLFLKPGQADTVWLHGLYTGPGTEYPLVVFPPENLNWVTCRVPGNQGPMI